MIYNSMQELIGNTPIVKLNNFEIPQRVNLFAKLEYYNPSGSLKDRTGNYMLEDAQKRGLLKQGGTIVEATAGNTGLGIAFAALNKGYKIIFCVSKWRGEPPRWWEDTPAIKNPQDFSWGLMVGRGKDSVCEQKNN